MKLISLLRKIQLSCPFQTLLIAKETETTQKLPLLRYLARRAAKKSGNENNKRAFILRSSSDDILIVKKRISLNKSHQTKNVRFNLKHRIVESTPIINISRISSSSRRRNQLDQSQLKRDKTRRKSLSQLKSSKQRGTIRTKSFVSSSESNTIIF